MYPDIFNDEAFSLVALTNFINNQDYIPGRAGEAAFVGTAQGVPTDKVALEWIAQSIGLIPTTARNAPAPQEVQDKAKGNAFTIPQIKLEDTINVSQFLSARQAGTTASLKTVQSVVQGQIKKMNSRFDLTLEHLRLTALDGVIRDSDGSVLLDLYAFFNVSKAPAFDFSDVITGPATDDQIATIRTKCHEVARYMKRNLKAPWNAGAHIHAFAGDNIFDAIVEGTREVYDGYEAAERRLGSNYAFGQYEFGGIIWENYQGTDDNSTVAVSSNTAKLFPVGIAGLYEEYYAPADFMETVGDVGQPRYAKIAPDNKFNRQLFLHVQSNPIPIVTRPLVLVDATFQAATESESA
jgi:hypothetical protein